MDKKKSKKQVASIEWREALALMKPDTYRVQVVVKEDTGLTAKSFPVGPEIIDIADSESLESLFEEAKQWIAGRNVQKCILHNKTTDRMYEMKGPKKSPIRKDEEHLGYVLRWSEAFIETSVAHPKEADLSYETSCRYAVRAFNKHVCLSKERIVYNRFSRVTINTVRATLKEFGTTMQAVEKADMELKQPPVLKAVEIAKDRLAKIQEVLALAAPTETKAITQAVKPARKKAATKA